MLTVREAAPVLGLAVEVEITQPLVARVSIYAALRVPEIWRYDGQRLRFFSLREPGAYEESPTSLAFPFLRPEHLEPFLTLDREKDETTRVREFGTWLGTL